MKVRDITQMAFQALGKNKIQTMLTTLGIVIGVSAVIAMVSVGQGASKLVIDLERLGYVERRGDPDDGRNRYVALTARGEDGKIYNCNADVAAAQAAIALKATRLAAPQA